MIKGYFSLEHGCVGKHHLPVYIPYGIDTLETGFHILIDLYAAPHIPEQLWYPVPFRKP